MVWRAKTVYKADWVINADADEFWYPASSSLKDTLQQTSANVIKCAMYCVYPEEGKTLKHGATRSTRLKILQNMIYRSIHCLLVRYLR